MQIIITGDPVIDNLKDRREKVDNTIKTLAYERYQLMRRVEEIDEQIGQYEAAQAANDLVKKDIDLRMAREKLANDVAEKKAAEEVVLKENNQEEIK